MTISFCSHRYRNRIKTIMKTARITCVHMCAHVQILLTVGDWRNMYLKPNWMQNVMNAYLAVMLLIPTMLLIFTIASFTQEGLIRDVSIIVSSQLTKVESRLPCQHVATYERPVEQASCREYPKHRKTSFSDRKHLHDEYKSWEDYSPYSVISIQGRRRLLTSLT